MHQTAITHWRFNFKGKLFSTKLNTSFVFVCSGSTKASYLYEVFISTVPGQLSCLEKPKWKPGCVHTCLPACGKLQVTPLSSHTSFCPLVASYVPTWNTCRTYFCRSLKIHLNWDNKWVSIYVSTDLNKNLNSQEKQGQAQIQKMTAT